MKVSVKEVKSRRDLRRFILFPEKLYRNEPNWVPALVGDEYGTLERDKNPAFEFCEAVYYLAYDESGKIVGRVAGIINHNANNDWQEEVVRFGWIDFVDDLDVVKALIDAVKAWGKARGCVKIKGPLGFTDMDKEGLLVEGYEHLTPFTCIFNFPYYGELLEKVGFTKDVDWLQKIIDLPEELPSMFQYAEHVEQRSGLKVFRPRSMKELASRAEDLFRVYNEAFVPLYEFSRLSDAQIKSYIASYVPVLNKDLVCMVLNQEDKVVGFAITVPSLSAAIRKCRGRLFPFGFIHVLKALSHNDTLEALMIGVLPEYQSKGVNVLMFKYLHENALKFGIKKLVLNPQLEHNFKVHRLFSAYNPQPFMRRRSYTMAID